MCYYKHCLNQNFLFAEFKLLRQCPWHHISSLREHYCFTREKFCQSKAKIPRDVISIFMEIYLMRRTGRGKRQWELALSKWSWVLQIDRLICKNICASWIHWSDLHGNSSKVAGLIFAWVTKFCTMNKSCFTDTSLTLTNHLVSMNAWGGGTRKFDALTQLLIPTATGSTESGQ